MAELWIIRHFRTPWNAENRLQGHKDLPLSDPLPPEDQAALAHNLTQLSGREFAAVWSSPLLRARQTAALHGFANPELVDELAELSFGVWEGRLWQDLHAAHPGKWSTAPQDLPLGEPFSTFSGRVSAILRRAAIQDGAAVLAFGHGAWINCAQAICAGCEPERMTEFRTANGALIRFELAA